MSTRADADGAFWSGVDDEDALNRYRTLVNTIDDGLYQLDAEGHFVAVNDVIVETTGYDRDELLGEHVSLVVTDDDFDRIEREIANQLDSADADIARFELGVQTAEGGSVPCELRITPLVENGTFQGTVGVARNVSEEKQRLETIETAQASYDSITDVLDEAEIGVFVLDDGFEITWADETIERYFGLDRDDLVGRDKREVVTEKVADSVADPDDFAEKVLDTYADNSYVERFDCRIGAGDGRAERWLEHYSRPIESGQYKGGRIELYYDITERKRSEVALRETEERFRSLVDAVEEYAIFRLDPEGHVISWNEGAKEIKGYESEEILGEHFSQFYTEEDRAAGVPEQNLEKATERGSVEDEGWRVREDGSQFWANVTITEVRDEDGTHRGYLKVTRDMTDRREYELQLEDQADRLEQQRDELEEELDNVFERIDDGFYALDDEFRFNYVNETAEEYLGKSADELIGRNYVDVIDVDEDDPLQGTFERAMATQESTSFERYAAALGMWAIVRIYPSPTGLSVYFRDITERKQRERELEEIERRFRTLAESFPNGAVTLVDENLHYRSVMGDPLAAGEITADELEDQPVREVLPTALAEALAPRYQAALDGESSSFEFESNGRTFQFQTVPVRDGEGDVFGALAMSQDITERKERERALEESEQRYRTLVEHFPNGAVTLVDEEIHYRTVGGDPLDAADVTSEEAEGQPVEEVVPPELKDQLVPSYEAALEGDASTFEAESNGRIYQFQFVPVRDNEGDVFAAMGMSQDITDRKERERELEQYETIIESLDDGVYVVDANRTFQWVNEAYAEMLGYPREELIGENAAMVADEEVIREAEVVEEEQGHEHLPRMDLELITSSGERVPVDVASTVLPGGEEDGWFRAGVVRDIGERKERERELERALDLLERTQRIADVGGWEIDVDTMDVFWTDHVFELLEVTDDEEPSLDEALAMYHEEDQTVVEGAVEEALETGDPFDIQARIRTEGGDVRWLRLQGNPETVDGDVVSLRGAAQDVTERKEREQRLEELIGRLEESNDRLEQFAYVASHDLREPLRMVSSYLQLLENRYSDELDEDAEEFIGFAVDGADRMREMIEGLLEYSRVETQGDPFEPVDLDQVLADVRGDLRMRIEESDADITSEELPQVEGDGSQLRQVFQNLLSNAIEYSGGEPPRIDITAERDGGNWRISVRDEGVGIDPEHADRIFEVFQRLHTHGEHPGTGIGLSLCQRIVERHGGEIWVNSEPGEGATFSFTLPAVE